VVFELNSAKRGPVEDCLWRTSPSLVSLIPSVQPFLFMLSRMSRRRPSFLRCLLLSRFLLACLALSRPSVVVLLGFRRGPVLVVVFTGIGFPQIRLALVGPGLDILTSLSRERIFPHTLPIRVPHLFLFKYSLSYSLPRLFSLKGPSIGSEVSLL